MSACKTLDCCLPSPFTYAVAPAPPQFGNVEQTYAASCPEGFEGISQTRTVSAGTYFADTQVGADALALAAAQSLAEAALDCSEIIPDCENLVPQMTSNTTPSGVASASAEVFGFFLAWKAFDRNGGTYWQPHNSPGTPAWLRYQFTSGQTVVRYIITGVDPASSPGQFTFEGSNDGTTWTVLNTQNVDVATWVANGSVMTFEFVNVTSYTYYRLNISTAASVFTAPRMRELAMYGCAAP